DICQLQATRLAKNTLYFSRPDQLSAGGYLIYVIDFKKFSGNGVHERIRTSDPRIHTASAFAAALPCWEGRSWSGLSLHHGP
ncbi:hypothetical protein NPN26_25160, partial [Vibrio parahaemolyticus]|nr:hypothetical protein [Vibrio parahaemolyticus]